jgi:hypothetical protein
MPARYLTAYCWRLGIRIPQDLSLLSADNDRYECRLAFPTLSSIETACGGDRPACRGPCSSVLMAGAQTARFTAVVTAASDRDPALRQDAMAYTDGDVSAFFTYLRDSFGENFDGRTDLQADWGGAEDAGTQTPRFAGDNDRTGAEQTQNVRGGASAAGIEGSDFSSRD